MESRAEKRDRVASILGSDEFSVLGSPTKKALRYKYLQPIMGYPDVSVATLCDIAGTREDRYYHKKHRLINGHPYDGNGRLPLLNEAESKILDQFIMESISRRKCPTVEDLSILGSILLSRRLPEYGNGATIPVTTMKRWIANRGYKLPKPLSMYEAKAKSDRHTILKMYQQLHALCRLGKYPDELIFNMDESWVATEEKQPIGHVVHTENTPPISHLPPDGKHVTLIACISKSCDEVPSAYIVPQVLGSGNLIATHHLKRFKCWFQSSGFMTKAILISWLQTVFIPHVNTIRSSIHQHALLICDAHSSRHNEDVWNLLKANNIDMLVLPAHVTSIFQPLDKGVFTVYKRYLRKYKDRHGMYELLRASADCFRKSTTSVEIDNGWNGSNLFSPNWREHVDNFPEIPWTPVSPNRRRSKSNYIVTNFNTGTF